MKVSSAPGLGTLTPLATERRATLASQPSRQHVDDPITFSSAARARAEAAAHPRWGAFSVRLHAEPDLADQIAFDFAHAVQQPVLDATEWAAGKGPLRYAATGEPYTPESQARFDKMAREFQAASLELYNQEVAKGTPSADIFDKILALSDAQPAEFLAMLHWHAMPPD